MIPILHAERLTLRPHLLADYTVFRACWMSDRAVHIGGPLRHEHEVWRQFSAETGHWALRGFGLWTLVSRAINEVLGWVGLQQPPHYAAPELAWHLTEDAEGKGYGFGAAVAALDHGRRQLGLGRIISYVGDANTRSQRLAERLGAHATERGAFAGAGCALYDHPVPA